MSGVWIDGECEDCGRKVEMLLTPIVGGVLFKVYETDSRDSGVMLPHECPG